MGTDTSRDGGAPEPLPEMEEVPESCTLLSNLPDPGGRFGDGSSALVINKLKSAPGSNAVWSYLTARYQKRLILYADHRLGARLRRVSEPEDIVQMATVRALKDARSFEYTGPASFFRWLCQKVNWEILNRVREYDRRGDHEPIRGGDLAAGTPAPDPAFISPGPITQAMTRDEMARFTSSLDGVPDIYRRVLVARYLEEKTRPEIAAEFNLRANTVSQQIARGLEHWRRTLGEDPLAHL